MIEAQHLTKRCRSTTAVDEVSFVVHPRRVTGLMAAWLAFRSRRSSATTGSRTSASRRRPAGW